MSAKKRILSGGLAIALNVAISLVAQVALVPVFLSHWDVPTYGAWLAIQGAVAIVTVVEMGFLDYIGFECMSRPHSDTEFRSRALSSGLAVAQVTGILLLAVAAIAVPLGLHLIFSDFAPRLLHDGQKALLILLVGWPVYQVANGLVSRILASVGEAPRTAWLTLVLAMLTPVAQLAAVLSGHGLAGTALAQVALLAVVAWPLTFHMIRRLNHNGIHLIRPEVARGFRMYRRSWALSLASFLEVLQQTGFRVVLAPLIGAAGVAQFSTLRTVVNTAQQSINTSIYPMIPEVMRYAAEGDRDRFGAVISGMWLAAVILIGPAIVTLQYIAPSLYAVWTHHRLPWDGITFALLSVSIVFNGMTQPARSIVRGNNLLRAQLSASFWAGVVLLAVTWVATGRLGLPGAALGLVGAEGARLLVNSHSAYRWLSGRNLVPPRAVMESVGAVALATSAAMLVLAALPRLGAVVFVAYLLVWALLARRFYVHLPAPLKSVIHKHVVQLARRRLGTRGA